MVTVSIIIPVYNVERFVARCLDSCINQTFKNIEIICVNDGSTDDSLLILEQYAKLDNRIKIIQKENGGLSSARNVGLDNSNGEYIFFLDSDDYIANNAIECLVQNIQENDSDFVLFDYVTYDFLTKRYTIITNSVFNPSDSSKIYNISSVGQYYSKMPVSAWCKLYKSKFLTENNIRFCENVIYEDVPFFAEVFVKANKFTYLPKPLLNYSVGRNGQIMTKTGSEVFDTFTVYDKAFDIVEKINNLKSFQSLSVLAAKDCLYKLKIIDEDLKESFFENFKNFTKRMDLSNFDKKSNVECNTINVMTCLLSASSYDEFVRLVERLD